MPIGSWKKQCGTQRAKRKGWPKYEAQEPGNTDRPDVERPPDVDKPEWDEGSDVADLPGAPPFTGEDAEDVGNNPQPKTDVPLM